MSSVSDLHVPVASQDGAGPDRGRRVRRFPSFKVAVCTAAAYFIAIVFLVPYAEMVVTAARPTDELRDPSYFPSHWTFSNFTTLWSIGLGGNIQTSLKIAGGATLLVMAVSLPAAYYTARHRFRGRNAFLLLVLVTQMFQPTAMLVGIYREFALIHVNPVLALILVNAGFNMAFAIWILNAYIASIPEELEEAAMVDGAGRFRALTHITFPLALPGVVTALIFTFIAAWNEFVVALILTSGQSQQPLGVALDNFIGGYQIDWGHLFAASAVATVPVIILFGLIEGKVVGGLTAGSVK
ncbi:carbohydrate ABC transporter membrane protein 2 (CUT1 family) [Jatrophihabitans sp. GAS493]|uniref:carbohydrate ABC transporter permease n=1 Tax=Jatrophihabitans sp. GAS493 TaxID=1907575 RepID=UPI000BB68574|nr:carbohydrate ABC transporter permease [Jatrophihabitans sp. GAS493]SOD75048.1 carbohydrate ABC transporter membrane protein 2 (CUT1 family) [Jatrophihabitans sp. GAS493]